MEGRHLDIHRADDSAGVVRLAQVLAHRLRGLVAGIEGFTDLLIDTLATRDQRELALRIMEGTSRIERVLSDLQRYGERLEPVILPVRIDEVLGELLVPLRDADRSRVDFACSTAESSGMLMVDPYLLRQALLALIQNALEATRAHERVRVEVKESEEAVCFEIWNPGRIDVEAAEDVVFVPFFTTKAHNLGVGLSMARRIAFKHLGRLELVANSTDTGIRFSLHIPQPKDDACKEKRNRWGRSA